MTEEGVPARSLDFMDWDNRAQVLPEALMTNL